MEKALIIRGDFVDLGSLIRVANTEGQKMFHAKREQVKVTEVYRRHGGGYVVVVQFDGCVKAPEARDSSVMNNDPTPR